MIPRPTPLLIPLRRPERRSRRLTMPCISLRRLGQLLHEAPAILLAIHQHPDADAIGSALGLAAGLRQAGKTVTLGCPDPVPERYRFLPGWQEVRQQVKPAALALVLDLNDPRRLHAVEQAVQASEQVAVLDHHPGAPDWPALMHIRTTAAATAVLVFQLLRVMKLPLTSEMATCLYCGLGGDTGFFTFQNTGAEALAVAARLVEAGAEPYEIHRLSAAALPLSSLRLRGRALISARSEYDGRLVYAMLRLEDFRETGAGPEETEGVVDELKSVAGGEVFVLFKQAAEHDWRISLRSDSLDVGQVARDLGGGGHAVASGCSLLGAEETVIQTVLHRLCALWS